MPLLKFFKQVFEQAGRDKVGQMSAAFAYGALFSLGPLLLVLISVVSLVFGKDAAEGQLYGQLAEVLGADMAKTIQDMVARLHSSGNNVVAATVGMAGTLLAAAGITGQLQNSFNVILGAVPDPNGGIKRTAYVKLKNVLFVLLLGVVISVSVIASALITGLGSTAQELLGLPQITLEIVNNVVSLGIVTGALFFLYRVLPDVIIPWKIALTASFILSALFVMGKVLLALIIHNNGTASAYGAAAVLISLLLWVYYIGQLLFMGMESVQVYGYNRSIDYKLKRYTYKRATIHLDGNATQTKLAEAWLRGFRKRKRR